MTELVEQNPLHKLYTVLNSIVDTIKDVNYRRGNDDNPKNRQWWFPYYPEKNDENYPRGSINFSSIKVQEYGGIQYVGQVNDSNGNIVSEQFGQILNIPVTLAVFVKKDQSHEATLPDGTKHFMQNQKLADQMAYLVHNALRKNRDKLITAGFDILSNTLTITPAYDDNHFLFAADVTFDIELLDVWNKNYTTAELIAIINKTYVIEQVN